MSLDPNYNKMKKLTYILTDLEYFKPKTTETQLKKKQIMKNVDELYEKYYNAYKNDYDADELSEAKKKKFNYRQFELFDKTDKKLELDGETKNFIKEIKNREKIVDQKGFMEYFSYEPAALVNNLWSQNSQDLRKCSNEIKQQKIKLNEDERNSTNNRNENDSSIWYWVLLTIFWV